MYETTYYTCMLCFYRKMHAEMDIVQSISNQKSLNGEHALKSLTTLIKQSSSLNFFNRTFIASLNPLLKNPGYISGQFMQDSTASLYSTKQLPPTKTDYKIQHYLDQMWLLILICKQSQKNLLQYCVSGTQTITSMYTAIF